MRPPTLIPRLPCVSLACAEQRTAVEKPAPDSAAVTRRDARRYLLALALLTLVAVPPAGAQQNDRASVAVADAQDAADRWLELVDHRRYGESWDSAAAFFRQAVSRPEWEQAVIQARRPLEPFGTRRLLSATYTTTLPNAPVGQYVVVQYETQAKGDRAVIETITPMRQPDGTWRVSGYFVRPR